MGGRAANQPCHQHDDERDARGRPQPSHARFRDDRRPIVSAAATPAIEIPCAAIASRRALFAAAVASSARGSERSMRSAGWLTDGSLTGNWIADALVS